MPRPKKSDPRGRAAYARLCAKEWELFELLIEDRQRELRATNEDPSMDLSQGDVIRWLILREANARGLGAAIAAAAEPPRRRAAEVPATGERFIEPDAAEVAPAPPRQRRTR